MEENETRSVQFEVNNRCSGQPDLRVSVSFKPGSSYWTEWCRVSKERKAANCRCEESDAGQLCQFTDTFPRWKTRWRLSGTGMDIGRVEEKNFNVNVTCKYITLYYITLYCIILYYIILYYIILYYIILYYIIYVMLYYIILYYIILYYVILYYIISYYIILNDIIL